MAKFFENSLTELAARNPGVQGSFKRIDQQQFTATVYREGARRSYCRIFVGSRPFLDGIAYSSNDNMGGNGFNESLSVHAGDEDLFLKPLGMALHAHGDRKLTLEGAAELYWDMFIDPLRR